MKLTITSSDSDVSPIYKHLIYFISNAMHLKCVLDPRQGPIQQLQS